MLEGKIWVHLNTCATITNLIESTEATSLCQEKTDGKNGITVVPGTTSINLSDTLATSFDNAGIAAGWYVSLSGGDNAGTYLVESVAATRIKLAGSPVLSATNNTALKLYGSRRKIRMYAVKAPQKPTRPYCTYQRISGIGEYSLNGYSTLEHVVMQIDNYSTSFSQVKQIAAGVKTSMDAATAFSVEGYQDMDFYESEIDCFRVSQEFTIWNKE